MPEQNARASEGLRMGIWVVNFFGGGRNGCLKKGRHAIHWAPLEEAARYYQTAFWVIEFGS